MIDRDTPFLARISWGAIFGGAILALAIQFMLSLLGAGIGLVSAEGVDFSQLGWSAALWMAATFLISLFCGGYVASRLSGNIMHYAGSLNSLVVWALVVAINLFVAGSGVGSLAKGFGNTVGFVSSSVNLDLPSFQQVTNIDLQNIQEQVDQLLEETDNEEIKRAVQQEIDDIRSAARSAGTEMLRRPGDIGEIFSNFAAKAQDNLRQINQEIDQQDIAQVFAAKTDMGQEEARQAAERWESEMAQLADNFQRQIDEARNMVTRQAQQAADTTGSIALWSFATLLLGMIVAVFGGVLGRRRTVNDLS